MITIFEWVWNFLVDLFVGRSVRGELTVSGVDEVVIDLPGNPEFVDVWFIDDRTCTPCDPDDDELDWVVKRECCEHDCVGKCRCCTFRKRWVLVIDWSVAGTRKIAWEAHT